MSLSLAPRILTFEYTNWKAETEMRRVETREMWFGTLERWYPGEGPQWFLRAIDTDKNAQRDFRLSAMRSVEAADGGAPVSLPPGA